jgi:hypothetical protein
VVESRCEFEPKPNSKIMSAKPKAQLAHATANPLAPKRRMLVDEVAPMDILPIVC